MCVYSIKCKNCKHTEIHSTVTPAHFLRKYYKINFSKLQIPQHLFSKSPDTDTVLCRNCGNFFSDQEKLNFIKSFLKFPLQCILVTKIIVKMLKKQ